MSLSMCASTSLELVVTWACSCARTLIFPHNGVAQPAARLIAQVFAKKVSDGASAVMFLNADTNQAQDPAST